MFGTHHSPLTTRHYPLVVLTAIFSIAFLSVVPCAYAASTPPPAGQSEGAASSVPPDTVAFIGPRLHFDAPVFDFGQVEQGEKVTHAFRFTNQGNRDLHVQSVKTSCGCTAAVIAADTIPPGTEGSIEATFDTKRFAGQKAKNIRVHTNDPLSPVTTLTIQGEITIEVQVQPAQLYLGRLQRGVQTTRTVTILYDQNKPFEITHITHANPAISVRTEDARIDGKKGKTLQRVNAPSNRRADVGTFTLQVSVSETAELGRLDDTITITTTSPKKPTITIPIFGSVEGDIIVLPSQVSFGVVRQGVGKTQTVRIKNRSAQPLSIIQVQSSLDTVIPELDEVTPGKEFQLRLHVTADGEPGKIRGSIEVLTDHPEEKQLTIPLFGIVAAPQQASR